MVLLTNHTDAKNRNKIIDHFLETKHNFNSTEDVQGNYTIDLMVDAIINFELKKEDTTYLAAIDRFFLLRNFKFTEAIPYQKIPFCDTYFSYFQLKKDSSFIAPYIEESYRMLKEAIRTPEGAICITHKGGNYMLIDYLQNYLIRMSRAGALSGDTLFLAEVVKQMNLYRSILQYPDSKLYSQGRGWLPDKMALSPSAWSRGQGWLMRGLVCSLEVIPKESSYHKILSNHLNELAGGLLRRQDKNGMWHTLPLLEDHVSTPEVSGTAMITYYMSIALRKGFLKGKSFETSIKKSLKGINQYLGGNCLVRNVSKGPGPLTSIEDYTKEGECDNLHGLQAIINLQAIYSNLHP